jgi:hypothetical protein
MEDVVDNDGTDFSPTTATIKQLPPLSLTPA